MSDHATSRRLRTTAVHAGEKPDPTTGAIAPNVVMATSYVVGEPLAFSIEDQGEDSPFVYGRWGSPTLRQLATKLAVFENAEACELYASGMAATTALLLGTLNSGDHLVVSDTNYAGTAELVRNTLPRFGIEATPIDTSDLDAVTSAIRPTTRLIFIETPVNPILRLADISAIGEIAEDAGVAFGVDSTFATPVATRPLELGADFVVHSLTKYIGGHGDAIGGAVLGPTAAIRALNREMTVHHGGVLSPLNAWLIMRGAVTLPIRMSAHEAAALAVAEFLEAHSAVTRVIYPGLSSYPQRVLADRQMANFGGMLTFQVADGDSLAERMRNELKIFRYAVSLGHPHSLIYWLPTSELMASSFRLTGRQLDSYRAYAGDGIFRVSVGLEDPADLIEDLSAVLP